MMMEQKTTEFLEQLSSGAPVPGGGGVQCPAPGGAAPGHPAAPGSAGHHGTSGHPLRGQRQRSGAPGGVEAHSPQFLCQLEGQEWLFDLTLEMTPGA